MATTWLTAMNRVLRTLGEDEIDTSATEITDSYHKLVSGFMNQIKEEIENAHNWRALRTEFTVTVSAAATSSSITSPSAPNEAARLWRVQDANTGILVPLCYDTTDSANPFRLLEMDIPVILDRIQLDTNNDADNPTYFAVDMAASTVAKLITHPACAAEHTVKVTLCDPQGWIDDDAITTEIKIPARPLIMGTLWYAFEERGEELGPNALFSEKRYRTALDEAVARDNAEAGEMDLVPV